MADLTTKRHPGTAFPTIQAHTLGNGNVTLGTPMDGNDWHMVVVYRGKHCPMCTKYLNELTDYKDKLAEIGVSLIAVSGDSREQLEAHLDELDVNFPMAYGLTIDNMKALGVYISDPRSEKETDHPFSEPALFVINEKGNIQVVALSNNPFVRPDIETLVNGLKWIRDPKNNYPVRGMHDYEQ